MSRKQTGRKVPHIKIGATEFPITERGQFLLGYEELLSHYPRHEAELLADLYELRSFVMKGDYNRYVHIMANFYDAEPKVGWQEHTRRIVARAREVAP